MPTNHPSSAAQADAPAHILHITDTHLFAKRDGRLLKMNTYDSLSAVLAAAALNAPDAVLATGDLAQDGAAEAYAHLTEALASFAAAYDTPPPVYWLPGNHDEPSVMRATLVQPPLRPEREAVIGRWYVILLDSTVPGEVGGRLSDDELTRLDAGLARHADRPALVCLHHNPISVGAQWMDNIGLANAEAFFATLDRHTNVRAVLWGHVHQEIDVERRGVRLMASPSTCIQFKPKTAEFGIDQRAPGYRRLWLYPDGQLDTKVFRVEGFAGCADPDATGY
ncbi:MAG: 3',5'-cyclic-AMP phosphodiesterase [Chloracidobacterium sp.]|nr:3',5'-cyclic-AMP phosphodiesterase [Chloracidobacterium sp.]MDW8215978.1 3',5'-cyclic-AMP phosphodiesterase [Acidobacteriota bacterium]